MKRYRRTAYINWAISMAELLDTPTLLYLLKSRWAQDARKTSARELHG